MQTVDPRVVEIALSRVGGVDFEKFCHSFFAASLGSDYVPMGGLHDGGADGVLNEQIFEDRKMRRFMQASTSLDPKRKIRDTIQRLREVGRKPKALVYATNRKLPLIDKIEDDLGDELKCRITIREGNYFQHHVNDSPGTVQAYKSYLEGTVSFLNEVGGVDTLQPGQELPVKTLCVFIRQELDRNRGKTELLEAVTDSLILWSLEGTDPDAKKFLSLEKIQERIVQALPSARTFIADVLEQRLHILSTKDKDGNRKVRFHRQEGYCLPYETREKIREENVDDEILRLQVSEIFRARVTEKISTNSDDIDLPGVCVEICHAVIHKSFLAHGLEITLFLEQGGDDDMGPPPIFDLIDEAIQERNLVGEKAKIVSESCRYVLWKTYYDSAAEERQYLRKLCRTYVLLFMIKNEPRIIEYFRKMTSKFHLYVGSDLIVLCLSEHLLAREDQMMKNTLKMLRKEGSKLILTAQTLNEVWSHLKVTHYEFVHNYQKIQDFMIPSLVEQIDKILIRSFFYAKLGMAKEKKKPITWNRYLNQFLTVSEIPKPSGEDELREYLVNEFKFEFEDEETLLDGISDEEIEDLARKIQESRNNTDRADDSEEILSRNSAAMVLRIYQKRKETGERVGKNPYGFKTWWLTQRTKIHGATKELVGRHRSRYMMRPEFILYFLSSLPSATEIQESYTKIFPTVLGIKLSNRVEETVFKEIIEQAREAAEVDESRIRVILANGSARLQSDFLKKY